MRVVDRIEVAHRQERQVLAVEGEDRLGVGEPPVGGVEDLAVGDPRQPQPAERWGDMLIGCSAGCDHASQAESGDQASPVTTPLPDAAISRTWPDPTSTTRSRPSCAATATALPSGAAASPVMRPTWPAAIRRGAAAGSGRTCRVAGADLQGVAAISVGRPDHLSAGP